MKQTPTQLPGVVVLEPNVFRDSRGFFLESFNLRQAVELGLPSAFVQDNHSKSQKFTLRGLHTQLQKPQGKLVRVTEGEIFDVAVDIRPSSPTFRKWLGVHLSAENFLQLYVPPGFAHGFLVLSEVAQVQYKVTDYYDPKDEMTVRWNDPEIGIQWPIEIPPLLSKRDESGLLLKDAVLHLPK